MGNRSGIFGTRESGTRSRGLKAVVIGLAALFGATFAASLVQASTAVQIVTVRTGDVGNGYLDSVNVTFNVAMKSTTTPQVSSGPGEPGFRVAGYDIDTSQGAGGFLWTSPTGQSVSSGTPTTTLRIYLVERDDYDTAATPEVTYEAGGGLESQLGDLEPDTTTVTATDGAGAVLLDFSVNDIGTAASLFNTTPGTLLPGDTAFLRFTEPVSVIGSSAPLRASNLEKAIQFSGCVSDADGISSNNFPKGKTPSVDPISSVGDGSIIKVERIADTDPSSTGKFVAGLPINCWAGIATDGGANILDAARNATVAQNTPTPNAHRQPIMPVDASVVAAGTLDTDANGTLDTIDLTVDQILDSSTLAEGLSRISIAVGEAQATLIAVEVGDASNVLRLRFTGVNWGTGETPTVSYTKPDDCDLTSGSGVKAHVPTAPPGTTSPYRTCLGSIPGVAALDKAAPIVVSSVTQDDGDGYLDSIRVGFNEPVAVGAAGWEVNGAAVTAAAGSDNDLILTFAPGSVGDTGSKPTISYNGAGGTTDLSGNQLAPYSEATLTDGAAPRIMDAAVLDTNADAKIDTLEVTYSEPIADPVSGAAEGFDVGGSAGTSATKTAADTLAVTLAPVEGTDAKAVSYTPAAAIADLAGNDATAQSIAKADVKDLAVPLATITVSPSAPLSAGLSTVTASFSEDMQTSAAPTVTMGSLTVLPSDVDHTNGWRNADPTTWDGSVEIPAGDEGCAVSTGCAVTITVDGASDLADPANAQTAATLPTEIDTKAPLAPVVGSFSAQVPTGQTVPADTVNMFVEQLALGGTIASDAGGGTARIVLDGETEFGLDDSIAESDTSVEPVKSFADVAAIRDLLSEGSHTLALKVCDDALNCVTTPDVKTITVDTTSVDIALTAPNGGNVVAGGSTLDIVWDAGDDADFDHVELDYSTDGGSTYPNAIDHAVVDRDGTLAWTVPSIDAADAKVRAVSVDAAGNKAFAGSTDVFAIDSSPPVVKLTSLPKFIPAGEPVTIRWQATDASIDRVSSPITIQYSWNNGVKWASINGGSYSHANDGVETWNVPSGPDFDARVRVIATDATDKTTTATSGRLVRGVGGYTVAHGGKIYSFGAAEAKTNESYTSSKDWVRGMALRESGTAGYLVSRTGRLYPFSIGGATIPKKPSTKTFPGDDARGVVLRTSTSGYVLHQTGRLYAFGGAPKPRLSYYWPRCDCARAVVMLANDRGGYVLDAFGRLHPFAVGGYSMPRQIRSSRWWDTKRAVSVVLRSDQKSGQILRNDGNVIAFGGAPGASESGDGSGVTAAGLIRVTDSAGYWVDNRGGLHRWGSAYGNPTVTPFKSSNMRATAGW